jgi:hypothetical protein
MVRTRGAADTKPTHHSATNANGEHVSSDLATNVKKRGFKVRWMI